MLALKVMCYILCAGSAVNLRTSRMSLCLIRGLSQHMASPGLVLSDTLILKQTRCGRPVLVKGASQKPSGWVIQHPLMLSCMAALKEGNLMKHTVDDCFIIFFF